MLELVWPGKSEAAQRAFAADRIRHPQPWRPQVSPQRVLPTLYDVSPVHRVIAGDNLAALRWYRERGQKFDLIYIDPPYNTGSPLTYNDKLQGRSDKNDSSGSVAWLNEIYPRLLMAREVLEETGVLFVSIDDNEVCHLLTVMREIFGRQNHLGTIKWRRKRKPSFLDRHMSAVFEYVLVFARNARACPRLLGKQTEEATRPVLNASNKVVERVIPPGMPAHCSDGNYAARVYTNRSLQFELLEPLRVEQGCVTSPARVRGQFRIHQELWEKTGFITKNFGLRRRVLPEELKRRHAEDDGSEWPTNEDAQDELRQVFQERVFDFPKPVGLLTRLLGMVPHVDSSRSQRCLDFYAGSGSFLIAALEQSKVDGVPRAVDLVQSRESIRTVGQEKFSDIAEICAHRVVIDGLRRGFSPSIDFLELEQQE